VLGDAIELSISAMKTTACRQGERFPCRWAQSRRPCHRHRRRRLSL